MSSFYKDIRKLLKSYGCEFVRQGKGDHEIWYSPVSQRYFTLVTDCRKRHTANETLKQAGIGKKF